MPMFDCIPHEGRCLYWIPTRLEFTPTGERLLFRIEYGVAGTRRFKRAIAFHHLKTGETGLLDKRCGSERLEFRSSPNATYFATMETIPRGQYVERGWVAPDESRGSGETIVRIEQRATGKARYIYLRPFRGIVDFAFDEAEQNIYVVVAAYTYHAVLRYNLVNLERELFFPKTLRLGAPGSATEIDGTQGSFFYLRSGVTLLNGRLMFLGAGPTTDELKRKLVGIGPAPQYGHGTTPATRTLPFEIVLDDRSLRLSKLIEAVDVRKFNFKGMLALKIDEALLTFDQGASLNTIYRVTQGKLRELTRLDEEVWQFALSPNGQSLGYTFAGLVDKDKPRGKTAEDQQRIAAGLKILDVATGAVTTVPVDKLAQSLANTPACWN